MDQHLDTQLFSGLTLRTAMASQQIFPNYAFNFNKPPKTLVAADERLIAMDMGYQLVTDSVEEDIPLRVLLSGAPYSGKTSIGHEFAWYAMDQVAQKEGQDPLVLYKSAFERSPRALANSLIRKTSKKSITPLKTPLDALATKLVEQTDKQKPTILFLDDLYSAHAEFVHELFLSAEDSNLHIFLSAMPDLEYTLKNRYHQTFNRQVHKNRVVLPEFDVIHLAAIIKQEAATLFDVPLTTEQALFFAEVDQVLTAKLPICYGTDRPFIAILNQLAQYQGRFLTGIDCRKITEIAATYEDFLSVLDVSQDAFFVLKNMFEYLTLRNEAGKCFVDKSDLFYFFEETFIEQFQHPRTEVQYEFGRVLEELEELGSIIPAEHLTWLYFCSYDVEDALAILNARFPMYK